MIIHSIVASGIQELYTYFFELYDHGKTPMEKKYKDEKRSIQLLNTVTVYLELADLTSMEYFVLKRYLPDSVFFFDSQFVDEHEGQPEELITKRHSLIDQIVRDDDSRKELIDLLKYPFLDRYHCAVELTGDSLLKVTNSSSALNLLIHWLGKEIQTVNEKENGGVDTIQMQLKNPDLIFHNSKEEDQLGHPSFEDFVGECFYKEFYRFYASFFTDVDLVSDTYRHTEYFKDLKYGECLWVDITSPVNTIHMRGDAELPQKTDALSKWYNIIRSRTGSNPDALIKLRFVTRLSLDTFLFLATGKHASLVSDWEDLKITLSQEQIHIVEMDDYKNYRIRIGQYLKLLNTHKRSLQKENFLASTNYLSYGTPITFVLSGSLDQMAALKKEITVQCHMIEGEEPPKDDPTNQYLRLHELRDLSIILIQYINTLRAMF